MEYNFQEIEKNWQQYWADNKTFKAENNSEKPKYYVLDMFPYPSGAGLHVGHPLGYIASDIYARFKRLKGFNVLHPMGYDSFGLPAEQYAIQTGQHPAVTTKVNIEGGEDKAGNKIPGYRKQLDQLGFSFDWDREVRTSNPDYYKWTQWIFLQLFDSWYNNNTKKAERISTLIAEFEANGNESVYAACDETPTFTAAEWKGFSEKEQQEILLNYRLTFLSEAMVNWCPELGTVLANDEVVGGVSERGGYPVVQKKMTQWSMRITAYAERLLTGLDQLDWTESIKEIQRNWIGKSVGAMVDFHLSPTLSRGEGVPSRSNKTTTKTSRGEGVPSHSNSVTPQSPKEEGAPGYHTTDSQMWNLLIDKAKHMRSNPTPAENALWQQLRAKKTDYKIRRQQVIDRFIVDFVCLDKKLVIEVDGDIHDHQQEEDALRTSILEDKGYKVIRYRNEAVLTDIDNVVNSIQEELARRESLPSGEVGGVISVFTTRPDTIFGVTYMTLAPEHELVAQITTPEQKEKVEAYVAEASKKSERDRMTDVKTISGEFTGAYAIHPFTGEEIPIWIGDYVLASYGTGAVMAVPCGDERDYAFAKHFNIPIKNIFKDVDISEEACSDKTAVIDNSDFLTGLPAKKAIKLAIYELEKRGFGKGKTNYRLRDAVFGRQRYWGEPIPMEYKDGVPYPLSENELPLVLPEVDKYLPTEDGEPPLARANNWKYEQSTMPGWAGSSWYFLRYMDANNTEEFVSKSAAEYWNQIDLYVGGAEHATGHLLYFRFWTKFLHDLGFIPFDEPAKKLINQGMIQGVSEKMSLIVDSNSEAFNFAKEKIFHSTSLNKQAVLIFLCEKVVEEYSFKEGVDRINVPINMVNDHKLDIATFCKNAPKHSESKTLIFISKKGVFVGDQSCYKLTTDDFEFHTISEVEKMSKSKYNVVSPDELCQHYGADTMRLYEMFLGPLEQHKPWDTKGIEGTHRFLKKLWKLYNAQPISEEAPSKPELKALHKMIQKMESDLERFSFNTPVSNFMICVNELTELKCHKKEILEPLLVLLSPYAPHVAEELWAKLGNTDSITYAQFPEFNPAYLVEDAYSYPVSFNGKMRFKIELPTTLNKEEIEKEVLANKQSAKWLDGKQPKKVIVVPKKIVNIVV